MLFYDRSLYKPKEPVIFVAKYRDYWYPMELYAAGAYLLMVNDQMVLEENPQQVGVELTSSSLVEASIINLQLE